MRQIAAVAAGQLEFDPVHLAPLLDLHVGKFGCAGAFVLGERRAGRGEGARFGHSPSVQHGRAKQLAELLDRRARRRRTARANHPQFQLGKVELRFVRVHPGKEVEPDRGNTEGLGAALTLEQRVKAFGIEPRTGEHELGSAHRRGKRQAPRVGVEERNHGEDRIARDEAECVGPTGGERVQQRRAMRVHHTFRIAGCAGGVAERRGRVLVERRPFVIGRSLREEILVGENPVELRLGKLVSRAKRHPAAHKRQAWG